MPTLNLTTDELSTLTKVLGTTADAFESMQDADLIGVSLATSDHLNTMLRKCFRQMHGVEVTTTDEGYLPLSEKSAAFRGGSFTESLYRAFQNADGDNRLRLEAAFPGLGAYAAKRLSA